MDKSPEAFRTISEVADGLETPAHVLRFWESRFPQIRPVKRAGGRRYYRPADVALLTGIKRLLHDEGMTIRGVQKILREQGIRHVAGLTDEPSPEEAALDEAMIARFDAEPDTAPEEVADETAAALEAALEPVDVAFPEPVPAVASEPAQESPAISTAPSTAASSALDWLSSLPKDDADIPADIAAPDAAAPVMAALEMVVAPEETPSPAEIDSSDSAAPAAAPTGPEPAREPARPALSVSSVTGGQMLSAASESQPDDATATLSARLRALPLGSLGARQEEIALLAARVRALRARLSGQMPSR